MRSTDGNQRNFMSGRWGCQIWDGLVAGRKGVKNSWFRIGYQNDDPYLFFITWICSGIAKMLFLLMSAIFCLHNEKKRKQAAKYNQSNERTYPRIWELSGKNVLVKKNTMVPWSSEIGHCIHAQKRDTAQKMNDFFSKCDHIRSFLWIW